MTTLNETFKEYLQANPQVTEREVKFRIYRLYDNYAMTEEEAHVAFDKVMDEVEGKQQTLNLDDKTVTKPSAQVKLNDDRSNQD